MKAPASYLIICLFIVGSILDNGVRPEIYSVWFILAWIWVGLRLTDREISSGEWRAFAYTWGWPIYVLKYGLFGHHNYTVLLNGVQIGIVSKQELKSSLKSVLSSWVNYHQQIRQLVGAGITSLIIMSVLISAVMMWAIVFLGKYDGALLVEIIRSWLENGSLPYVNEFTHISGHIGIAGFVALSRNCFAEIIKTDIRVGLREPALGQIIIKCDCRS